jgi:bacterioferritin (cytochrome b1)
MDTQKVVKKLNEALERELGEVVKYLHQSFWVQGVQRKRMVGFFREQSRESMDHAIRIGEQIVALGGTPVVKILEIYEPKPHSLKKILQDCVKGELAAMNGYKKMLPLVEDHPGLHRLLSQLATEEGQHVEEIKKMAKES